MQAKSVLIIGAGVGGIATAARLAQRGYAVTVLEKNDRPGGRASLIRQEGFTFDTGPSLLLMPATYAETYTASASAWRITWTWPALTPLTVSTSTMAPRWS